MKQLKSTLRIGFIHAGFWFLYLFLLFIIMNFMIQGKINQDLELIRTIFTWFLVLPAITSYITFYWLVFKVYTEYEGFNKAIFVGASSSILIALVYTFILEFHLDVEFTLNRLKSVTSSLYIFEVFLCTVVGSIAFIIRTFGEWFKDQKLKKELVEKSHRMELEAVKAQLDPHFLFNSLNNIDVLILKNPHQASEYLNKLSDLLRYTLNPSNTDKVNLDQEIDHLRKYIDLQKIRSNNQGLVDFQLIGDVQNIEVPSFIFLPFIENAFKYHQHSDANSTISIRFEVQGGKIVFSCSNKIAQDSSHSFTSFQLGNEIIKRRLDLIYAEHHQLIIDQHDGIYKVTLELN